MLKRQMTIKTPGKLMVAGEFAVLEPYHRLVVMAVDRFVYCTIKDHDKNELSLNDFDLTHLHWEYTESGVKFNCTDARIHFVKDAMTTTLTYLQEQSISIRPFSLSIKSELDDKETGAKYGLGSSAAVVTSVVNAILTMFIGNNPSRKLIFKLAAISHIRTQGNGSGADIAASTYGGVLLYASFQADWLKRELKKETSMTKMVKKDWEFLSIKKIDFPDEVQSCIGWTGSPASTANLVQQISKLKEENRKQYEMFLRKSEHAVNLILSGMKSDDLKEFFEGITENRKALADIGKHAKVEIETEKLYKLSKEAERFGGAGKLSGAGGGDCGIAFLPRHVFCEDLYKAWSDIGIQPLQLNVCRHGSQREHFE